MAAHDVRFVCPNTSRHQAVPQVAALLTWDPIVSGSHPGLASESFVRSACTNAACAVTTISGDDLQDGAVRCAMGRAVRRSDPA